MYGVVRTPYDWKGLKRLKLITSDPNLMKTWVNQKLWKYLNNLGYSSKSKSKAKIVLNVDGTLQSDTYNICNHVNKFFTSVVKDLTNKLPHVSNDYGIASDSFERFYLSKGVTINEFELKAVDEDLIYEELASMNIHRLKMLASVILLLDS